MTAVRRQASSNSRSSRQRRGRQAIFRDFSRDAAACVHRVGGDSEFFEDAVTKLATFETTKGTIVAELYAAEAPKTVENFEKLANSGFYDGVKFHRVIPDFVVQGGDPLSRDLPAGDRRIGTGGPGWRIACETAGNPHKHAVGSLSMAHAGKDTGGSQFFMVLSESNTRHLNGVHTVFGQITGGIDVMKQIVQDDAMTTVRVADAD